MNDIIWYDDMDFMHHPIKLFLTFNKSLLSKCKCSRAAGKLDRWAVGAVS